MAHAEREHSTTMFQAQLCLPAQFATFDVSHSPVSELPVGVWLLTAAFTQSSQ